jgi:hypothetical protein
LFQELIQFSLLTLGELHSSVELSDLLLDIGRQINVGHGDVSGINLILEVSSLAENLGHEYGKISENNGINDSTS